MSRVDAGPPGFRQVFCRRSNAGYRTTRTLSVWSKPGPTTLMK